MPDQLTTETTANVCPSTAYQAASVCVPVTVSPFAKTGTTATKCCGAAVVKPGTNVCKGTKNGACTFTISQNICVEVPVEFGATANVGDTYVDCIGSSVEDICIGCDENPDTPSA